MCNHHCFSLTKKLFLILLALLSLYLFICSLSLLSISFRLIGGQEANHLFKNSQILQNPIVAVMLGVLATIIVQSSSTTTSIVVSMVGSDVIQVRQAIPIIMGANIGTSITNTLVSLAQIGNRSQFELAFACAVHHDIFNWLAVIVLLPTEIFTSILFETTQFVLKSIDFQNNEQGTTPDLLGALTKPLINEIVQIDSDVINQSINQSINQKQSINQSIVGPANEGDERVYHAYYQWVPFLLIFQAGCFYAPHLIWKNIENGRTRALLKGVSRFIDGATNDRQLSILAKFLCELEQKNGYGDKLHAKFVICEFLNLINTIIQMFLTNRFLGNIFFNLGLKTLYLPWDSPDKRNDSMSIVFPRMTKCDFRKFGPSGSIELFDVLCVLPMNILHEKIFIILFFHFLFLFFITSFMLIMRLLDCQGSARTRTRLLSLRKCALMHPSFPYEQIKIVVKNMRHGQFFLLKTIAKNLDSEKFALLVTKMAEIKERKRLLQSSQNEIIINQCNTTNGLVKHSV